VIVERISLAFRKRRVILLVAGEHPVRLSNTGRGGEVVVKRREAKGSFGTTLPSRVLRNDDYDVYCVSGSYSESYQEHRLELR